MERICNFLKEAGVYYLATMDGDQPRVRPFGTAIIFATFSKFGDRGLPCIISTLWGFL